MLTHSGSIGGNISYPSIVFLNANRNDTKYVAQVERNLAKVEVEGSNPSPAPKIKYPLKNWILFAI